MELSSENRSEIQHDLSNMAFKYIASFTQIEKLHRNVDWLKHQIFNALAKKENVSEIEKLIDTYEHDVKKLKGYGQSVFEYQQDIHLMLQGAKDLKNED